MATETSTVADRIAAWLVRRGVQHVFGVGGAKHHDPFDVSLGGFAHAGDYTAAALIRWQGGA